jgi:TonB family protein
MTPIVKDPENAASPTAPGIPAAPVANAAARPQPVALEVPVTVNGARSVDGSDKREPFSERSQTVLVFGHGAVLRISAQLAPGQLVFLTNEKTKKEVVCVVVKSKTDGNAVGYVELRFTEPAPGFWGMRFPSDTVLPQAPARSAAPALAPVASKAAPVAPPVAPKPVIAPPPAPVSVKPEIPKAPTPPPSAVSPVAIPVARATEPAVSSVGSSALFAPADSKTVLSSPTMTASTSGPQSTDELKQQAARLQEQLSSLLFADAPKTSASTTVAAPENFVVPELAQKVLDLTNVSPEPAINQQVKGVPPPPKPRASSLEVEEIKIPSWLAPLARESETPAAAQSSAVESNSFEQVEAMAVEPLEEIATPESHESARRPEVAIFGGQLLGESSQSAGQASSGSKTGLFLGIAASLLLVAGGVWYSRQPGNAISGLLSGSSTASQPATSPTPEPTPSASKPVSHPDVSVAVASSSPVPATVAPPAAVPSAAAKGTPLAPAPRNTNSISSPTPSPTLSPRNATPVEEPKKPALGDVRLATPVINHRKTASAPGDSEPSFDVNASTAANAPPLSAHGSGPAAPVPIGGDVKPAKLLKSVQPVYPQMARTQHVSGNVQVDALIDADGNVSAMKVLSGPALLRDAALQSLKQWKYQPAELDGKPTSMHLTVTLQFRAQ